VIQLPLFEPKSDWREPDSLPEIPSGVELAVDTETRDNGLANERGPGWAIRDGHVAGVSVAWNDEAHYIPIRHPDTSCMSPERIAGWIQDAHDRSACTVFHNSTYDAGWLLTENVVFDFSKCDDTQFMSVMIDENQRSYNLNSCCLRAGIPGKSETELRDAASSFGLDAKKDMWRLPAKYVAAYAMQDAVATLGLLRRQRAVIAEQQLTAAYRLEMDLVPMFIEMRKRGVTVNESTALSVQSEIRSDLQNSLQSLRDKLGWRSRLTIAEMNSPKSLKIMFDQEGVEYPLTAKKRQPSFSSDWMSASSHWLPKAVVACRQMNDLAEKFIGTYILSNSHLGRIHSDIHQLRDDDGGTRSYRLSYSDPPLQQIPARTKAGMRIRSTLVPQKGKIWCAADYSQQEPRMAVHYSGVCKVDGAEDAIRYYRDDPSADFHSMVAEITGLTRKQAKIINLGLMYGMGLAKLASDLGVTIAEAQEIVNQYHERMPFIKKLNDFCQSRAETRGYIKLLDGARCRFDLWELAWGRSGMPALPYERALAEYRGKRIKRAGVRKAMNRLIQGSSARQTKLAMLECFKNGLTPLLQMHDELDFEISEEREARLAEQIMLECVSLMVPMKVDVQFGWSWGQASEEAPKGISPPTFDEVMKFGSSSTNSDILAAR